MKLLKRILKIEAGQALPMALILLVLGGLLVVPMLSFMTTSLNANRTVNTKTLAIYAADAGIQDALWKLGDGVDLFASGDWYDLAENVNGMTVTVDKYQPTQQMVDGDLYTIRSTAYLNGEPKAVIIAQAVAGSDYYNFFDSAINGVSKVTIKPNTTITGPVKYGTTGGLTNQGCIDSDSNGTCDNQGTYDPTLQNKWPSVADLSSYYYDQVDDLTPFASSQITISGNRESPTPIPHLYRDGSSELKGGGWARLGVDTKVGTADATEANFLLDTCGGFATSDVGSTVWNTTDNTTAKVTSYVNSSRLGIDKDIMASGETYTVYNKNCPVYVTGALSVNPNGGCVLDLNGNTFFSGDTIYLGPKTTLRGSGCFIAVGNITFQPNTGSAGDKLVGVDYTTSFTLKKPKDTLLLSKFTAEHTGKVKTFSVLTSGTSSPVKLAIYTDAYGEPGQLMSSTEATVGSGVDGSGLNDIDFPETAVEAGKSYWLAAISKVDNVIGYKTCATPCTWKSRIKTGQTYLSFNFTQTLTGLTTVTDQQYLLAGNALPFIFVMSITGSSDIKPNGTLYGSIAGDAEVEMYPNCELTLTAVPDTGLNFPGNTGSGSGSGTGGNSPPLLNYNIQ